MGPGGDAQTKKMKLNDDSTMDVTCKCELLKGVIQMEGLCLCLDGMLPEVYVWTACCLKSVYIWMACCLKSLSMSGRRVA